MKMPKEPKATWDVVLDIVQTAILVASLLLATTIAYRNDRAQANRDSGDFMLRFDQRLHEDSSAIIIKTLDRDGNLNNLRMNKSDTEDALVDFFNKFQLLDLACDHNLIDRKTAYDGFEYYLEKALKDKKAQAHLIETYKEDGDVYNGVFDLARQWNLSTDFMPAVKK